MAEESPAEGGEGVGTAAGGGGDMWFVCNLQPVARSIVRILRERT